MGQRKAKAQQIALTDVDTRPRKPATVEHRTDFTRMQLGLCAGNGWLIVRCPVCLEPCIAMGGNTRWSFVHAAVFVSSPRHLRMHTDRACALDCEIMDALAKEKTVKVSASGGLLEAQDHAPVRAMEIETARAERRKLTGGG